jgi:hypothetical protein
VSDYSHWSRGGKRDWTKRAVSGHERRAEAELLRTKVVIGIPGSGKSYAGRHDIKAAADAADTMVHLQDMHGLLNDFVIADIGPRHEGRMETLDIDKPSAACGIDVGRLSDLPDPEDRAAADDSAVEQILEAIGGEQEVNFNTMPLKGGWARKAMWLRWRQDPPKPFWWVKDALRPGHPRQIKMLEECWDRDLVAEFERINAYRSVAQQDQIIRPGRQLLDVFFDNRFVAAMLTKPPVNFDRWLVERKILLVRASTDTPEAVVRTVFWFLRHLHYRAAMRHLAETGEAVKSLVYLDEAGRLRVNGSEVNLNQQTRKAGVATTTVYQSPPRTQLFKDQLAASSRLEIFAQGGADDAEWAAREALALLFDMRRVKAVEKRERVINRGVDREEVKTKQDRFDKDGKKIGTSEGVHILSNPRLESVFDTHETLASHQDQLGELVRPIRKLGLGDRLVITDGRVIEEHVPEVEGLCQTPESRKAYVAGALERIRSRPHYARPVAPVSGPLNGAANVDTNGPTTNVPRKSLFERLAENGTLP